MDDDILSQGDDREPRPFPRRLAVIAAVVLAVAGGIVYLALPRHQHAASAAASASASASAPAPVPAVIGPTSVGPARVTLAVPGIPVDRDGGAIRTQPWDESLRLPVGSARPTWFLPASGRSEPIEGPPADSAGYQFTRVDGGWAVQANAAAKIDCDDCAGSSMPVWFVADGASSATRVGTASQVAPAASAGAMWLMSYPAGADVGTAAATAWEVGPTGAVRQRPTRLPAGSVIEQGTDQGLLLGSAGPRPGTAVEELWNPASRSAVRSFDHVLAANATEVAWAPACARGCDIDVLNLPTGRDTVVRLPAGTSPAGASFSPGGSFLALQLGSGDDGALMAQLDVASVANGRLTEIPGTWISSDDLTGFGWPSAGDSMVVGLDFKSTLQLLLSWQPRTGEVALAVVQPGAAQPSLVIG